MKRYAQVWNREKHICNVADNLNLDEKTIKEFAQMGFELLDVEFNEYDNKWYEEGHSPAPTNEQEIEKIRERREIECFSVLSKYSAFYFQSLTVEQNNEIKEWYQKWLDAPATKIIPNKPKWFDN